MGGGVSRVDKVADCVARAVGYGDARSYRYGEDWENVCSECFQMYEIPVRADGTTVNSFPTCCNLLCPHCCEEAKETHHKKTNSKANWKLLKHKAVYKNFGASHIVEMAALKNCIALTNEETEKYEKQIKSSGFDTIVYRNGLAKRFADKLRRKSRHNTTSALSFKRTNSCIELENSTLQCSTALKDLTSRLSDLTVEMKKIQAVSLKKRCQYQKLIQVVKQKGRFTCKKKERAEMAEIRRMLNRCERLRDDITRELSIIREAIKTDRKKLERLQNERKYRSVVQSILAIHVLNKAENISNEYIVGSCLSKGLSKEETYSLANILHDVTGDEYPQLYTLCRKVVDAHVDIGYEDLNIELLDRVLGDDVSEYDKITVRDIIREVEREILVEYIQSTKKEGRKSPSRKK